jgi:HD-like signal output (HDOD) protein
MAADRNQYPGHPQADAVSALESLPPLPAIALRVMGVAQNPKSSASDLAIVVSADPGLSARILRIVNSAAYRRQREITSVQEALVTLGFVQARNVAISGAISSAYKPDALNVLFRIETFWRHSLAVAFKAADLAAKSRRIDVPSAFTAGILHNMGRLAMFYADPAGLDQAVAEAIRRGVSLDQVEEELIGYDHAHVGGLLALRWKLPSDIRAAIAYHHDSSAAENTLAGVVYAADQFCAQNDLLPGYIVPPPMDWMPDRPADFRRLMDQVEALMELVMGNPVGVKA